MKKNDYVFGAALAAVALSGVPGLFESKADGAIVAGFSFENSAPAAFPSTGTGSSSSAGSTTFFTNYGGVTAASIGPLVAESGTGSAYGVHASASTVYTTPIGNGSNRAVSANTWAAGDYYQFTVSSTGFEDLLVSFDQTASGTGPKNFSLVYNAGSGFVTFTSYVVGATAFTASVSTAAVSFGFDLSAVAAIEKNSSVVFRLVNNDAGLATGGANRIDNFIVNGTAAAVPEPVSLAAIGAAGVALLGGRRRKA